MTQPTTPEGGYPSSDKDDFGPDSVFTTNPLVRDGSYIKDPWGRMRYMGPTSTWSFYQRAIATLGQRLPQDQTTPSELFAVDGSAFKLTWVALPPNGIPDLSGLPQTDHGLYMFHTVKFHLGYFSMIIDEPRFLARLHEFEMHPEEVAQSHRLWLAEYILILAFGEAFLNRPSRGDAPAGTALAARALALLPDLPQLHEEGLLSIEVLSLVALYLHCLDMRVNAFLYIGQALRLATVEGIHREIPEEAFGAELSQRCKRLWWVLYVLDRRFSSLLGAPSSIRDDDVGMTLPWESNDTSMGAALSLSIQLSRVLATIMSTVYSTSEKLDKPLLTVTKDIIHKLADIGQQVDQKLLPKTLNSSPSRMVCTITLMYHHCILHATRPFVMCLLKGYIYSEPQDRQKLHLTTSISNLLKTSTSSAMTILKTLSSLEKSQLIESFLPFDLEFLFSSAILLCIIDLVCPDYITDQNWLPSVNYLLDAIIRLGNVSARLRKAELHHLLQLLAEAKGSPGRDVELAPEIEASMLYPGDSTDVEQGDNGGSWSTVFDLDDTALDPSHLLDLALQLDREPDAEMFNFF
ncbi:unnamed protein product [Clonostachys byssicola]|uniref:Xylanolytic transcriptional activator regulatory domain-containing protein n=1 Tax=Clonostachys byssicola TaxID=160290 RepID=A0A9N9YAU2_9HYPO|nr:unnamed protein product [Clonostachys byssicola]